MPLRICIYVFLIALLWMLFLSTKQKNSEVFSMFIRTLLPFGLLCFVLLGWGDIETRREIAQNYREYDSLKNQRSLRDAPPQMLDGIENIPPGSVITEGYGGFRLDAPRGGYFSWGSL